VLDPARPDYAAAQVYATLALRESVGEVDGIALEDFDFDGKIVKVRRQM
jgi:hypothetical protein